MANFLFNAEMTAEIKDKPTCERTSCEKEQISYEKAKDILEKEYERAKHMCMNSIGHDRTTEEVYRIISDAILKTKIQLISDHYFKGLED